MGERNRLRRMSRFCCCAAYMEEREFFPWMFICSERKQPIIALEAGALRFTDAR